MRFAQSLLIGGAVLLAPAAARAQNDPAAQVKDVAGGKPTIELVFVIDTTGSMGGLIEGAKQKVWSIVNEVMKSPSKPEVRMGLVAYRDHGRCLCHADHPRHSGPRQRLQYAHGVQGRRRWRQPGGRPAGAG